jgi:regulator of sigma E protease
VWVKRGEQRIRLVVTPAYDEKQLVGRAGWGPEFEVEVATVMEGMGAQQAGILRGDILLSANGIPLRSTTRLNELVREAGGKPVTLTYSRSGAVRSATVTPAWRNLDGQERWMIGVQLTPRVEVVKLPFPAALAQSVRVNAQNTRLILTFLEGVIERRMSPRSIEGPIRIAQMSGEAAREGASAFVFLMAGVSLNLAIFNLLPIPILDGGQLLLLLVEMIMRRDLDLRLREMVVRVGFVFLMVVVVFVIYNDISKILPPG